MTERENISSLQWLMFDVLWFIDGKHCSFTDLQISFGNAGFYYVSYKICAYVCSQLGIDDGKISCKWTL